MQALLGQGRCLVALGKGTEAGPPLQAAREIFARLRAEPALTETERLLEWTGELGARDGDARQDRAVQERDGDRLMPGGLS